MDLSNHAPSRPRRRPARSLVVVANAVILAATLATGTTSTPASGHAEAAFTPATSPAVDAPASVGLDEPGRADDEPRTGPDPTGHEFPPRSQRIIDSAVWLWLLACVSVAVVAVTRRWWRTPSTQDARRESPESEGDQSR